MRNFEKIVSKKSYSQDEVFVLRNAKRKKTQMRGGYARAIKRFNVTDSSIAKHDLSQRWN